MEEKKKYCPICGNPLGRNKICCSRKCYSRYRQHTKICIVCKKEFDSPPTDKVICCSPECTHIRRVQLINEGKYIDATQKMLAGLQIYNANHTGEKHHGAKYWKIQAPDGQIYEVKNLMHFIKCNPELFDGTAKQAFDGFAKIKASYLGKRKNPAYSWKGWRLLEWN